MTALLPFMEPWSQQEHDHKLKRSSVSSRYAAVLILQMLQSEWTALMLHIAQELPNRTFKPTIELSILDVRGRLGSKSDSNVFKPKIRRQLTGTEPG